MSSFQIDQYVYNIPSRTIVIYGFCKLANPKFTCLTSTITINLVFSQNISSIVIIDVSDIILSVNLICPGDQISNGTIEYDTAQFLTVNADHPLIRQIIPLTNLEALPPCITIRLPTQKVIKVRPVTVSYSHCLEYFKCTDYVLKIDFPTINFTNQFNFSLELRTTKQFENYHNQILKTNCGGSCASAFVFNSYHQKINLLNNITSTTNQIIICFYPHNKIKTNRGYIPVREVTSQDWLVSINGEKFKVNQVFSLPIFGVIPFIKFPVNCISQNVPNSMCFLTLEHMVKTQLGTLNAEQYYLKFKSSHGIDKIDLYTDYIYSFEVLTKTLNVYVEYQGLPARVWSLNEKDDLKRQLNDFKRHL